jgi:hypothetical protein
MTHRGSEHEADIAMRRCSGCATVAVDAETVRRAAEVRVSESGSGTWRWNTRGKRWRK